MQNRMLQEASTRRKDARRDSRHHDSEHATKIKAAPRLPNNHSGYGLRGLMHRREWSSLAGLIGLALASVVLARLVVTRRSKLSSKWRRETSSRALPFISIYVPVSLQSLDVSAADGCTFAESDGDSYDIAIYGRLREYAQTEPLPCERNDAGMLAELHGERKPIPDFASTRAQRLKLRNGEPGWFIPASCGGSCAPATLYWQMPHASYWLQMELNSELPISEQRKELLDTVNSLETIRR